MWPSTLRFLDQSFAYFSPFSNAPYRSRLSIASDLIAVKIRRILKIINLIYVFLPFVVFPYTYNYQPVTVAARSEA
jgi:hypothetical protein